VAVHQPTILDDPEIVIPEPAGLRSPPRDRHGPRETMGLAAALPGGVVPEVPAWDVDGYLAPELVVVLEGTTEVESLGVPKEPGGVVVFLALDGSHSGDDLQAATLGAEGTAGGRGHRDPE
jgi:hypothetical protein